MISSPSGGGSGRGPTISIIASIASIAVLNGRVWPGKPGRTALAIASERILATGSDREIRAVAGPGATVLDAAGGLVLPGFNDAHVHFLNGAHNLENLELSAERTVDGILGRVGEFARTHGDRDWLLGRGWFYAVFPGGMPRRDLLDAVVPDRPTGRHRGLRQPHHLGEHGRPLPPRHYQRHRRPASG